MKRYTLTKFAATNIANIDNLTFETNGDVLITGQNGAGKSTIKKAVMWALIGTTADGEKFINSKGLPKVEVTISDGTTSTVITKQISQRVDKAGKISRRTDVAINNLPAAQKDLNTLYEKIVPIDIFRFMVDIFGFNSLDSADQRAILLNHFAKVNDADIISSDEEFGNLQFGDMSPEKFIAAHRAVVSKLKSEVIKIPPQIELLQRQIGEVDSDALKLIDKSKAEIESLNKVRASIDDELKNHRAEFVKAEKNRKELDLLNRKRYALESTKATLAARIESTDARINELLDKYNRAGGNCPTCGQALSEDKVAAARTKIVIEGKKLRAENSQSGKELAEVESQLKIIGTKIDALNSDTSAADEIDSILIRREEVGRKINSLEREVAQINGKMNRRSDNEVQIGKLVARQKELGKEISAHEYQMDLAESFILKKTELVTAQINSHFEHVAFKMYETQKNGEIKNVCVATLNGVDYQNLSKGEKLMAALDILNAFQEYYGVKLPVIIDDAESYTSNTLGAIDNQQILLKVVEGAELTITVDEGSVAA